MKVWGRYFSRNAESGLKRPGAELFMDDPAQKLPLQALQRLSPEAVQQLQSQAEAGERSLGRAVQVQFRYQDGQLEIEPFEALPCTPQAALRIGVQLVAEGILSERDALIQANPETLRQMVLARLKPSASVLATGRGNGWGACCGQVAHDYAGCLRLRSQGIPVLLCVEQLDYSHRDCLDLISGALISAGTSLALDQLQKPCVLADLPELQEGRWIAFDSLSGQVFGEGLSIQPGALSAEAKTLLEWADRHRTVEIRANVSGLAELQQALDWGAAGVGLLRLDTLVLRPERLSLFQTCLRQICGQRLSQSPQLTQLTAELQADCRALFELCGSIRFNLRLLDAPMSLMLRYWKESGSLPEDYWCEPLSSWLQELNPPQGLRGGRVGLLFPTLFEVQMRACLRARQSVRLQIMVPGVCDVRELELARQLCRRICSEENLEMPEIGCMLELPRACLTADRLAECADFLSFGTGDLSESFCGISRYDAALSFLPEYLSQGVFDQDPFQTIDQAGVGALMRIASEKVAGRRELGTCGAQAVHPASLQFCAELGLDYVSVPARHLPAVRLLAAQICLKQKSAPV